MAKKKSYVVHLKINCYDLIPLCGGAYICHLKYSQFGQNRKVTCKNCIRIIKAVLPEG